MPRRGEIQARRTFARGFAAPVGSVWAGSHAPAWACFSTRGLALRQGCTRGSAGGGQSVAFEMWRRCLGS
eukprot:10852162-Alexandrium_andersonii.AAC.1